MHASPPAFTALLHRQCGLFTRSQAYACGVTRGQLDAQLAARRWRSVGRGVVVAFTGPWQDRHRAWAAVLTAGEGAALSHETAAHRHELVATAPVDHHVIVPSTRRVRPAPGIVVHRTRSLVTVVGSPPTTDVASTLFDLCSDGWSGDRLAAAVATAVQRRLVSEASIARALDERGRFRGSGELRDLLRDAGDGAHSVLELRFLRDVERRHGLPRGERQARVRRGGRVTVRDVHYPEFGVTVELDGRRDHGSFAARLRDARRDRLAAADGDLTLRYGWWDIAVTACAVAAECATVLTTRGWHGRLRECASCGTSDMA